MNTRKAIQVILWSLFLAVVFTLAGYTFLLLVIGL